MKIRVSWRWALMNGQLDEYKDFAANDEQAALTLAAILRQRGYFVQVQRLLPTA